MDRLCLTRRCGLCHFDFREKDEVIAVKPDGKESKPFEYRSGAKISDSIGRIWCNACANPCVHKRDQAVGCHLVCRKIPAPVPLARFLKITAYSFEPTLNQERKRRIWLLQTMATTLKLPGTLSRELRQEIAQYLLQEYAVRTNILLLRDHKAFQSSLTILNPVVPKYVSYEGEKYVSSLINEPERKERWPVPTTVYMAEDHRGVRNLIWTGPGDPPSIRCIPGVFWKALPIQNSKGLMEFSSNGPMLYSLSCRDSSREWSTHNLDSFAIPRHPLEQSRSVNLTEPNDKAHRRMSIFQYNRAEITGFSVCCNPAPIALSAHVPGDDLSFYQSTPSDSSWIYVPLEKDEHITSIWIRHPYPLWKALALAFGTDKGHLHLLGIQTTPALSNCPWELVDVSNGEPAHFFFDSYPSAMNSLMFDSKAPRQPRVLNVPKPLSPHPDLHSCEDFHWSQASVENVVAVSPCRQVTNGAPKYIGLLLHYSDRRTACVGQVRLDCLDPPLTIESSSSLCLGFKMSDENRPYIARMEMSATHEDKSVALWFEVSWNGIIEWWFSYRQCQIWQDGRRSLPTRA